MVQRFQARAGEVGGIPIARNLPARGRRQIGAWCFLDHIGPVTFEDSEYGLRVGPHPHIGLQTFTWVIDGELLHRDSLGTAQPIRPGEVNLMTAGRGISHTEESLFGDRQLHGAQLWIALPEKQRNTTPRFDHYSALPRWHDKGATWTLLTGQYGEQKAETLQFSPLIGLDIHCEHQQTVELQLARTFEYGVMPLTGNCEIGGEHFEADELAYLGANQDHLSIDCAPGTRMLVIGGEPLDKDVVMWWNYVGYNQQEIVQAERDWEAHDERFGSIPQWQGERLQGPPSPWRR